MVEPGRIEVADVARRTILMFSGGRDSSLAAARLAEQGEPLLLVTVTSTHLVGIDRVSARLSELRNVLPLDTPWLNIRQPEGLIDRYALYDRTCLPCHHLYVVVAVRLAYEIGASAIAFGYVAYQNSWPEQTPLATSRLGDLLSSQGIKLLLPVYDLPSRAAAIEELKARSLSTASLEQKCLVQTLNVALSEPRLREQLAVWESAIRTSLGRLKSLDLEVLATRRLGHDVQ